MYHRQDIFDVTIGKNWSNLRQSKEFFVYPSVHLSREPQMDSDAFEFLAIHFYVSSTLLRTLKENPLDFVHDRAPSDFFSLHSNG